jgi:hypothetical protein
LDLLRIFCIFFLVGFWFCLWLKAQFNLGARLQEFVGAKLVLTEVNRDQILVLVGIINPLKPDGTIVEPGILGEEADGERS